MTSYESMTQKLAPLGLYRLTPGTQTDLELRVYADELDRLFGRLDEITRECFIATAQDWGVAERERFFGKEKTGSSLEVRRELLMTAERETGSDPTPEGCRKFLRSCGAEDFEIIESPVPRQDHRDDPRNIGRRCAKADKKPFGSLRPCPLQAHNKL
ncbi:MAG: hypothetical protein UIH27_19305 [Ruminococcus sp.]|nr:hypothetical protein [Ruminococcus sp.]